MRRKPRILVVEDDEHLRRVVGLTLTFAGFDVSEARDGIEALQLVDRQAPDLILLDLLLPGLDGVAVRQEIAAHAFTRHIPIVVMTGAQADLTRLDVACVLKKPVDPDEVVRTVQRCLPSGAPAAGV